MNESNVQIEMPRYKCHKEVWALKIKEIKGYPKERPTIEELDKILNSHEEEIEILPSGEVVTASDGAMIIPYDEKYVPIHVDKAYLRKHNPQPDGYYVVYDDGYKSFSPAKAFEDGYTLVK